MSCDIEATIDQRPIDVEVQGAIVAMDLADGDYGDIAVSNNGATMTIENMGENATVTTGTYVSKVNQDLLIKVRKASAGTITKGQAVYIVGSTGNHLSVELARADAEATSAYTIGIAATTITNTTDGFVIQNGRLTGLSTVSTTTFADGDAIYLSETTAGGYRVGIPEAPNHGVFLGFVIRANNGNAGELDVRIDNYQELEELSDVYVTGSNVNDFLVKKATRWENTTPANVKTILAINNVDNTSDANKPISTATQTALNAKVNKSGDTMTGALVNSTNGAVSTPPMSLTGSWYNGGTSTTTKPQVLIEPTGTTSTNWSTAGTGLGVNAASGFTGNLLDLQTNGARRFAVSATGDISTPSGGLIVGSVGSRYTYESSGLALWPSNQPKVTINTGQFNISNLELVWTSNTTAQAIDLILARDAANTLAQRNGTNAQTFRIYNTFTNSTNYERGRLEWIGNELRFGPEALGTGVVRSLGLYSGATRYQIIGSNYNQFDKDIYMNVSNIVTGGDGFKIGTATTQKIGFYNATPVAQPAAVADATDAASVITQLNLLLARMRTLGLIAT